MGKLRPDSVATCDAILREVRAARFGNGVRCPRCCSGQTHRWGRFAGRQRYRCRGCRRTFSDLTGSAAAFTKKLALWPSYYVCLAQAYTVRRAADATGIHRTTSFRWRHAILRGVTQADRALLVGLVQLEDTRFAYSQKGERKLKRPPRVRGVAADFRKWLKVRRVLVTVAYDQSAQALATITGSERANFHELTTRFLTRVRSVTVILSSHGRFSPYARLAKKAGIAYRRVRRSGVIEPDLARAGTIWEYLRRMRHWLRRFRGVATRYLDHYLFWHRLIDGKRLAAALEVFAQWAEPSQ